MERVRASLRRFLETDVREGDWVTVVAPEQQLWWTARNAWEYSAARGRRRPPRRPGRRRQLRRLGDGARAGVRTGGDWRDVRRRDRRRIRLERRSRPIRRRRRSQRPGQAGAGHRAGQAPYRDQPRRPAAGARVAGATAGAEVARPRLRGLPAPAEDAGLPRGDRRGASGERGDPPRRSARGAGGPERNRARDDAAATSRASPRSRAARCSRATIPRPDCAAWPSAPTRTTCSATSPTSRARASAR